MQMYVVNKDGLMALDLASIHDHGFPYLLLSTYLQVVNFNCRSVS